PPPRPPLFPSTTLFRSETARLDDRGRGTVELAAWHARPRELEGCRIGAPHDVPSLELRAGRRAEDEGSGRIALVAVHRRPEIDQIGRASCRERVESDGA